MYLDVSHAVSRHKVIVTKRVTDAIKRHEKDLTKDL
jgi:hypothetical protein